MEPLPIVPMHKVILTVDSWLVASLSKYNCERSLLGQAHYASFLVDTYYSHNITYFVSWHTGLKHHSFTGLKVNVVCGV